MREFDVYIPIVKYRGVCLHVECAHQTYASAAHQDDKQFLIQF